MVLIEIVPDVMARIREDNEYIKRVMEGKAKIKPAVRTIIATPETFAQIFTPERLKLLLNIRGNGDKNIYQIAKELGRSYEAVYRDIKYLESFKLIKIRTKERKKLPYMDEPIQIPAFA